MNLDGYKRYNIKALLNIAHQTSDEKVKSMIKGLMIDQLKNESLMKLQLMILNYQDQFLIEAIQCAFTEKLLMEDSIIELNSLRKIITAMPIDCLWRLSTSSKNLIIRSMADYALVRELEKVEANDELQEELQLKKIIDN